MSVSSLLSFTRLCLGGSIIAICVAVVLGFDDRADSIVAALIGFIVAAICFAAFSAKGRTIRI